MKSSFLTGVLLVISTAILPVLPLISQEEVRSQEDVRGVVIYASGTGFELVRNGETREYDLSVDVAQGIELQAGDYINTYNGTFLEIQLTPSESVVKISENTSFRVESMTGDGGGSFEITYGRVRARVKKLAGLERFSIDGPSMVAGVRGTDFGYDIIFEDTDAQERTVASVYCFEGEVEVETKAEAREAEVSGEGQESESSESRPEGTKVLIGPEEMVKLIERKSEPAEEPSPGRPQRAGLEFILVKETIDERIREYWNANDFQGTLIEIPEKEAAEEREVEVVSSDELIRERRRTILRRAGAISGGMGVLFGAATLTFAYADSLLGDMDEGTRDSYTLGFGALTGLCISTSLFSYLFSLR